MSLTCVISQVEKKTQTNPKQKINQNLTRCLKTIGITDWRTTLDYAIEILHD